MRSFGRKVMLPGLVLLLVFGGSATASAQEGVKQYRAAVTKVFLSHYYALPVFHLNPVFPGSVVRLSNETLFLAPERCYANPQRGQYRRLGDYTGGQTVAVGADLKLKGELLSKHLAEIGANTGVKLEASKRIVVSPLSVDSFKPDAAALRNIRQSEDCNLILRLLDGQTGGFVVAAEVLHGQVRYRLEISWRTSLGAAVRSDLIARIAKVFAFKETEIAIASDTASFTVLASPDPLTLAIIPERLSLPELARITYYLQGQRGADLEIKVREALIAGDLGAFEKAKIRVRELIGDEIKNKERWAENFVTGKEMVKIDALRSDYRSKVDMGKVATYAAAMEIIR